MNQWVLCFLIVNLSAIAAFSQSKKLHVISDNNIVVNKYNYKREFTSPEELNKEVTNLVNTLQNNGWISASVDSFSGDSTNIYTHLHIGERYEWAILRKGNVDPAILAKSGYKEKLFSHQAIHYLELVKLKENILIYCENNGYPFASIKLDSIEISDNSISASLNLNKNTFIKTDSIEIKGNIIAPIYLYSYLGIKPGKPYNEKAISAASNKIKELTFIKEQTPYKVEFNQKYSKLIFDLAKKRGSQFDGFIGILPNDSSEKLLFTGDVRLKLQNIIRRGELIEINWRSLQQNTQDLRTNFNYPFLLSTALGIDHSLKIYKRDTSFIDIQQNIGLQYLLTGGNFIKVFVNQKKSNVLYSNVTTLQNNIKEYADMSVTFYGIGIKQEKLDYRINPRKGYSINASASTGNKKVIKNASLQETSYNDIPLRTVQYTADLNSFVHIPVMKKSTIRLSAIAATLIGPSLFRNELMRIGGLKTLRGFDEESIWASSYGIGTVEYRYLAEENSYLFLFYNAAWYEDKSINFNTDTPMGFGTGISFETKAGIFSVSYALGKQFNNPFQLRSGKIHFGLVNYF